MHKFILALCLLVAASTSGTSEAAEFNSGKVVLISDTGDTTILITLSKDETKALKYNLADIGDWIQQTIKGKLSSSQESLAREWKAKLEADPSVTSVPVKTERLAKVITDRADYKDKATREAEEK